MTETNKIGKFIAGMFQCLWLIICLSGGLYAAWWIWPSGITQTPLASLTLGMIAKAIAAVFIPFIGVAIAVNTISDD